MKKTSLFKSFNRIFTRNIINIRLISDVHLEINTHNILFPHHTTSKIIQKDTSNVCVLAGDIGHPSLSNYATFLHHTRRNFDKVLLVPGNHEYMDNNFYRDGQEIVKINRVLKAVCKKTDCNFLQMQQQDNPIKIGKYWFAGCTLWHSGHKEHKSHIEWLKKVLKKYENVVVITHYAPSFLMIPQRYKNYSNNNLFASDLDYLIKEPVKMWLHGHTHGTILNTINDIVCASNCVGYKYNETTLHQPDFDHKFTLTLDS